MNPRRLQPAQAGVPLYIIDSRESSPVPVAGSSPGNDIHQPQPPSQSASPPPYTRHHTATQQQTATQPRVLYAVRVGNEGEVFTSSREAWARCLALERAGENPGLVVANSLSRALAWIRTAPVPDGEIFYRHIVQEALEIYRGEQTDSSDDDSTAPPDNERSTAELVAELNAREARAHWRRRVS
ncbi:hypothetical protein C8R46DRAFT_1126819 [Mycena filopes]|nr:hypothetical protein C8R46DRAFT_1126819 [Mycena filopes]